MEFVLFIIGGMVMSRELFGIVSLIIVMVAWVGSIWLFIQMGIKFDEASPALILLVVIGFVYLLTVGSYKEKK